MHQHKYLIIGGGLAGDAAARGIRELDTSGSIGMLSMEPDPPYLRPALSKGLWKGRPLEKIWRRTEDLGVDMVLGKKVTQLDLGRSVVRLDGGDEVGFDKLLLATGGTPRRLPLGGDDILYYRDLQDYHRLRALAEPGRKFLVIGGGFIGSEIAAALTMAGCQAVMVFPGSGIGANIFPADLSAFVTDTYREKGVEIHSGDEVTGAGRTDGRLTAKTRSGRRLDVDGVVAGIGISPNVDLAQRAGLKVDNGIVVDAHLQTSARNVFAAGDAANFMHAALGKRVRVEHEDNALHMGKMAGRNMAGAGETYDHVPMFYSDLFDLGYEAVGELDSRLETVADWQEPFKKGVIYYLGDDRVRGVLLWNTWEQVNAARDLLARPGLVDRAQLTIGRS